MTNRNTRLLMHRMGGSKNKEGPKDGGKVRWKMNWHATGLVRKGEKKALDKKNREKNSEQSFLKLEVSWHGTVSLSYHEHTP